MRVRIIGAVFAAVVVAGFSGLFSNQRAMG